MTPVSRSFVFLFVLSLCPLLARADVVGGEDVPARDPIHDSTAALYTPSRSGPGGALCTASLIGRDTAVTAAHCIDPKGGRPVLIFGDDVRSPESVKKPVTGVAVNPRWKTQAGHGMDQGDIAVVKFPGGLPAGYHPATIQSSRDEAALHPGEPVTLAGYGISDARTHAGAGKLRETQVGIASVRKGKSEMILDQSHGHGACHGDSGGPAYVRSGGKMVLAGVTNRSYPASAPDDCAHRVVYTKTSAYEPWIKQEQNALESAPDGAQLKKRVRLGRGRASAERPPARASTKPRNAHASGARLTARAQPRAAHGSGTRATGQGSAANHRPSDHRPGTHVARSHAKMHRARAHG